MYRRPHWSVDQSQWQRSWLTSPLWVISLWQPAALWWLLPSQEHASHTCQSASPPPTPFPAERQHHSLTTLYLRAHRHPQKTRVHTSTRAHAHTRSTQLQTPFALWWQILLELAPICESRRGVLYESNSPVICLSQMDLWGVQGPCLVAMVAGSRAHTYFPSFQGEGGNSPTKGVRLIITPWLGLIR